MTSSSNAGLWQPFLPAPAAPESATAFAPGPLTALAAAAAATGWLPSLHSGSELRAEESRRALEDEVYRRGVEDGARAERARADARCATALQAVAVAVAHLDGIAGEFARDREADLHAIAITVARHVVQHELAIDPMRVGELVRRGLELMPLDHTLEVRIHPADLETLGPSLAQLAPPGRDVHLQWLADPAVERGGFAIETPHRIIDGRTDVALRTLYERFDHE